jgi:hypothetical protein
MIQFLKAMSGVILSGTLGMVLGLLLLLLFKFLAVTLVGVSIPVDSSVVGSVGIIGFISFVCACVISLSYYNM